MKLGLVNGEHLSISLASFTISRIEPLQPRCSIAILMEAVRSFALKCLRHEASQWNPSSVTDFTLQLGLFEDLIQTLVPVVGKHLIISFCRETRNRLQRLPFEDLCVGGTGGGRGRSSHQPTHLCVQKQEGNVKKGREVGRSEISRAAAGRRVFIIYCLLFAVYCSIERTSKWLYGKKKKKKRGTNTDGMLMRILCNRIKMPGRRFPYGVLTGGSQGRMVRVL